MIISLLVLSVAGFAGCSSNQGTDQNNQTYENEFSSIQSRMGTDTDNTDVDDNQQAPDSDNDKLPRIPCPRHERNQEGDNRTSDGETDELPVPPELNPHKPHNGCGRGHNPTPRPMPGRRR